MTLTTQQIQTAIGAKADGIMGPNTRKLIVAFQKAHGLDADGKVGPKTEAVMRDILDDGQVNNSWNRPEPTVIPEPPVGKILWPTQAQCPQFYGPPGQVKLQSIEVPYPLYYGGKELKTISVHTKIAAPVKRILQNVKDHYGVEQINTLKLSDYSGCYNPRRMRGGTAWSMHAYACALDFNAADNQLRWGRDKARFGKPIYERWWELWEAEGAVSLGRASNFDWMHVQFARLR